MPSNRRDQRDDEERLTAPEELTIPRRELFRVLGWSSLVGAAGLAAYSLLRFSSPPPLDKERTRVPLGGADRYANHSLHYVAAPKVFVKHDAQGLAAMSAVCTHLACVVRWNASHGLLECPCHGSRFDAAGKVLRGPARRDLPYFRLELATNGQLVADVSRPVSRQERLDVHGPRTS
ncbi:MAG: Rieske 2Fe-2S domain-containing protein [Candidatus Tectomicrobia bacterium]|nr:Rieske 2Fe-2S domain-containing protein [Candidatus Tectomicrobia bacterium]